MTRFYGFVGSAIGSYAGWWLGAPFGMMPAFVLGMVGTGAGFYLGRRVAKHYQISPKRGDAGILRLQRT